MNKNHNFLSSNADDFNMKYEMQPQLVDVYRSVVSNHNLSVATYVKILDKYNVFAIKKPTSEQLSISWILI